MSFLENCRKAIAIDSTASQGTTEMAKFIGSLCVQAGLNVEYQKEKMGGQDQCNIVARFSQNQEELMLQGHLDTVDPGLFSLWSKTANNPFNASIHSDRIYGVGVADGKLDLICKLEALKKFKDEKFSRLSPVLVGTYGEEFGMAGAIKLQRRKRTRAKYALIGKPTSMQLCHAGLGSAVIEISVPFTKQEQEYHLRHDLEESSSSQTKLFASSVVNPEAPQITNNAIYKLLDYLNNLPEGMALLDAEGGLSHDSIPQSAALEIDTVDHVNESVIGKLNSITKALKSFVAEFSHHHDERFVPPHPTMNIGQIKTRKDHIRMTGTCRVPPSVSPEVYSQWMENLKTSCEEVQASFQIIDYKQSFHTSENSEFVSGCQQALSASKGSPDLSSLPFITEASVFSRLGVECLVFGPGEGVGNSREPDEYVSLKQLEQATDFYCSVIESFCL